MEELKIVAAGGHHWIENEYLGIRAHLVRGVHAAWSRPLNVQEATLCGMIVFGTVSTSADPLRTCGACMDQLHALLEANPPPPSSP